MKENTYIQLNLISEKIPKCFNCNCDMILDHIDSKYDGNGNYDNYFICKKCNTEIIQNVKFVKIIRNIYIDEDGKIINVEQVR